MQKEGRERDMNGGKAGLWRQGAYRKEGRGREWKGERKNGSARKERKEERWNEGRCDVNEGIREGREGREEGEKEARLEQGNEGRKERGKERKHD